MQSRLLTRPPGKAAAARPVTLVELIDRTPDLPALPTVALAAHRETGREGATAASVADIVAADPALTARVLRLANSAHFGAERRIASVQEAVTRLGMRSVRNLCLLGGTYPWLKGGLPAYGLAPGELLRHSLAAAVGAKAVAERAGLDGDAAFTAGLLHDLGKVALAPWLRGVVVRSRDDERRFLGFDHAQAGGELTRRWNLPLPLTGAIACHHMPVEGLEDAVHLGDGLAHLLLGSAVPTDGGARARRRLDDLGTFAEGLREEFDARRKVAEACA